MVAKLISGFYNPGRHIGPQPQASRTKRKPTGKLNHSKRILLGYPQNIQLFLSLTRLFQLSNSSASIGNAPAGMSSEAGSFRIGFAAAHYRRLFATSRTWVRLGCRVMALFALSTGQILRS
jgi:hypothetical protein